MIKPDRILLCDPREDPLVTPGQEAGLPYLCAACEASFRSLLALTIHSFVAPSVVCSPLERPSLLYMNARKEIDT